MGFSGGGSNVLKPHKHSSAVQDGSPLNMVNVTEGSLNSGDTIYSDGNALQRLAVGAPGTTMTVSGANIPSWAAAASGAWTLISEVTAGNSIDVGSGGGSLFSGYEFIRCIGTFSQTVSSNYFALGFYNAGGIVGNGNYAFQGIFGSAVAAVAYSTSSSVDYVQLGFVGAGCPIYFDFTFSVQGNGNASFPNRCGETKSQINGGHGNQCNFNSSVFGMTSASDISGWYVRAGASGSAVAPVAGSVYMKVFGA